MNLPQLPQDKANHALWGAIIFIAALAVTRTPLIAAAVVVVAAAAKEASDAIINYRTTGDPMHGPHGVEFLDFAATCFGGVLAALPLVIMRF
jgi:hypothetical protein